MPSIGPPSPGPRVVATEPADGAVGVARVQRFRVLTDLRLGPRSIDRGSVRIVSGDRQEFLSMAVDPIDRAIEAIRFGGRPLEPFVAYRIVVDGVRDLDDHPLAEPFTARFTTGDEIGELPARPVPTFNDVFEPILIDRCAGTGCHGPGPAALGLDLTTPEAVRATAIGVLARQVASTAGPEAVGDGPGLVGLPIIDVVAGVGNPATSYLLYKVLGDAHATGDPMPPDEPLDPDDIRLLSDWIRAGAPTEIH